MYLVLHEFLINSPLLFVDLKRIYRITEVHWGTGALDVVLVWQLQLWRLAGLWGIWDCSHCSVVVVSQFHGIPELSTWFCLDYKDGFMKAAPAILVRPFGLWQLCHNICRGWSYLIWEPSRYTDNTNGWHGQWKGRNCSVLLSATSDLF